MTKKESVIKVLEELGHKPKEDEDGDLFIRYQMKRIFPIVGDENEQYLRLIMPQFVNVTEGEEHVALAICNKLTRELKFAKVYVEQTLKNVSACCEFYYTDEASMKNSIEKALAVLGMARKVYRDTFDEFTN